MLHYVHQLVSNCVRLLFGAEQLPAADENSAIRAMNQNSKVSGAVEEFGWCGKKVHQFSPGQVLVRLSVLAPIKHLLLPMSTWYRQK